MGLGGLLRATAGDVPAATPVVSPAPKGLGAGLAVHVRACRGVVDGDASREAHAWSRPDLVHVLAPRHALAAFATVVREHGVSGWFSLVHSVPVNGLAMAPSPSPVALRVRLQHWMQWDLLPREVRERAGAAARAAGAGAYRTGEWVCLHTEGWLARASRVSYALERGARPAVRATPGSAVTGEDLVPRRVLRFVAERTPVPPPGGAPRSLRLVSPEACALLGGASPGPLLAELLRPGAKIGDDVRTCAFREARSHLAVHLAGLHPGFEARTPPAVLVRSLARSLTGLAPAPRRLVEVPPVPFEGALPERDALWRAVGIPVAGGLVPAGVQPSAAYAARLAEHAHAQTSRVRATGLDR